MPGPGGGSHGGGFSGGGGFHSGGFSGGSRGGGYRGGYRGGFFFGPRFYYGGCLGPFFGWFFGPIIMLSLVAIIFFFVLVSSIASIGSKELVYDESKFQKYADQVYAEQFAAGEGYEDHILIVFLTEENAKDYHCIAWVGNDIHYKINELFGDENTPFGRAMLSSINDTDYTYQLTTGLSMAVEKMQDRVTALELSSSFRCNETHVRGTSHMVNRTDYSISETTVNGALQNFTDATGIEIVIMVDEGSHVFDRVSPVGGFLALAVLLVIIGFLVWIIVRNVKNKKNKGSDGSGAFNGNPRTDNSDPYGNDNW